MDQFNSSVGHVSVPGAASFTVGMPNMPAVYAVRAALGYIRRVGVPAIERAARPLVLRCLDELKRMPVELLTPVDPDHRRFPSRTRRGDHKRMTKHE